MKRGAEMQHHLVASMGNEPAIRPTVCLEHRQCPGVLDNPVAQNRIHLYEVPVRAHSSITHEISDVLHREQVFAGGHRMLVVLSECALQGVIERVPGLLVPKQPQLIELSSVEN